MSRLKMATTEYEDLLDRLQSARIELQIARAAFKYRFTIVIPAELPKKVTKPKVPLLIAGGVFLAIVFGIGAAVAMDFATGRVLEEWQVQRQLGLPVLASLGRTE
jgi:uncharacterized protein involved in exopolysaccharide biosynthesis